ncbi:MAG: AAA family ATPase, partial [Thermoanaerobaculia bacterium]
MITDIEIEGFKSLEKVHLKLGKLNLFIGTNASGKSNFFDALRVLQGIGYGLTVNEIFNGKPKSAGSEVWDGIRGGSSRARFFGRSTQEASGEVITFKVSLRPPGFAQELTYSIAISSDYGLVKSESLEMDSRLVYKREGSTIRTPVHESDVDDLVDPDTPAL